MNIYLIYNHKTGQIWRHLNNFIIKPDGSIEGTADNKNNLVYSKKCNPAILRITKEIFDNIDGKYDNYTVKEGKVHEKLREGDN